MFVSLMLFELLSKLLACLRDENGNGQILGFVAHRSFAFVDFYAPAYAAHCPMQGLADRPRNHRGFTPVPYSRHTIRWLIGGHLRKRLCSFRGTGPSLGTALLNLVPTNALASGRCPGRSPD